MNKKLVISLCVVFGVVTALLIMFWTLFGLSSVSVEFHTTKKNLTITNQEIVDAGQFRMGACVLFEGKNASIRRIEEMSKENPNFAYLKVLNIETVFPNKFVIHVAEREELFAVKTEKNFLICDRDLKVLNILEDFQSQTNNAILLEGLEFSNLDVKVGDFLNTKMQGVKKVFAAFVANNQDLAIQRANFSSFVLSTYLDKNTNYVSLTATTFGGRKMVIKNLDFALTQKIQLLLSAENALFNHKADENGNFVDENGQGVFVKQTQNGLAGCKPEDDGAIWMNFDLLSRCTILVDNLVLDQAIERTEKDIFWCLVL